MNAAVSTIGNPSKMPNILGRTSIVKWISNLYRPAFALQLCTAMVLFMLAKNISSGNDVTIDEFQYWTVGLIPFLFWTKITASLSQNELRTAGKMVWLVSLAAYLFSELTYLNERFPLYWRELFDLSIFQFEILQADRKSVV